MYDKINLLYKEHYYKEGNQNIERGHDSQHLQYGENRTDANKMHIKYRASCT